MSPTSCTNVPPIWTPAAGRRCARDAGQLRRSPITDDADARATTSVISIAANGAHAGQAAVSPVGRPGPRRRSEAAASDPAGSSGRPDRAHGRVSSGRHRASTPGSSARAVAQSPRGRAFAHHAAPACSPAARAPRDVRLGRVADVPGRRRRRAREGQRAREDGRVRLGGADARRRRPPRPRAARAPSRRAARAATRPSWRRPRAGWPPARSPRSAPGRVGVGDEARARRAARRRAARRRGGRGRPGSAARIASAQRAAQAGQRRGVAPLVEVRHGSRRSRRAIAAARRRPRRPRRRSRSASAVRRRGAGGSNVSRVPIASSRTARVPARG